MWALFRVVDNKRVSKLYRPTTGHIWNMNAALRHSCIVKPHPSYVYMFVCVGGCACVCVFVWCQTLSLRKCVTQIWLCRAESKEINYRGLNRGHGINIWLTVFSLEIKTQLFSPKYIFRQVRLSLSLFQNPVNLLSFPISFFFSFEPFSICGCRASSVFSLSPIFLFHCLSIPNNNSSAPLPNTPVFSFSPSWWLHFLLPLLSSYACPL